MRKPKDFTITEDKVLESDEIVSRIVGNEVYFNSVFVTSKDLKKLAAWLLKVADYLEAKRK